MAPAVGFARPSPRPSPRRRLRRSGTGRPRYRRSPRSGPGSCGSSCRACTGRGSWYRPRGSAADPWRSGSDRSYHCGGPGCPEAPCRYWSWPSSGCFPLHRFGSGFAPSGSASPRNAGSASAQNSGKSQIETVRIVSAARVHQVIEVSTQEKFIVGTKRPRKRS